MGFHFSPDDLVGLTFFLVTDAKAVGFTHTADLFNPLDGNRRGTVLGRRILMDIVMLIVSYDVFA